jgi:hypothetical protein
MALLPTALLPAGVAGPLPITEAQVKAAYLYNFAKFIAWPDESFAGPGAPIRICSASDPSFEHTLKEVVNARTVDAHPVQVLHVTTPAEARTCHILFVSSGEDKQARAVTEVLGRSGVVTVGETQDFLEKGGVICFTVHEGRVHFQINLRAAAQAGVYISARLLNVATRVVQ